MIELLHFLTPAAGGGDPDPGGDYVWVYEGVMTVGDVSPLTGPGNTGWFNVYGGGFKAGSLNPSGPTEKVIFSPNNGTLGAQDTMMGNAFCSNIYLGGVVYALDGSGFLGEGFAGFPPIGQTITVKWDAP